MRGRCGGRRSGWLRGRPALPPGVAVCAPARLRGKIGAEQPPSLRRERLEWIQRRLDGGWIDREIAVALQISQQAVNVLVRRYGLRRHWRQA